MRPEKGSARGEAPPLFGDVTMKTKLMIAAALGATAIAGGAYAWQAAPMGDQTRAQFLAKAGERFDRMDADKNGVLTAAEHKAHRGERRGPRGERGMGRRGGMGGPGMMAERLDTDNDGRISRAEAAVPATRMFDRVDTNRDGYIDKAEREAMQSRREARRDMAPPPPMDDPDAE